MMKTSLGLVLVAFFALGESTICSQTVTQRPRGTGAIPLSPEVYDALPPLTTPASGYLPPRFTLENYLPTARDQGDSDACTSFASTENKTYRVFLAHGMLGQPDDYLQSPAYVYSGVTGNCHGGTTVPSNINYMAENGSISESRLPFDPNSCQNPVEFQPGTNFSKSFEALNRNPTIALTDIKAAIASGNPVISLIRDCKEFKRAWGRNYIPAIDVSEDVKCGYHSILIVGYDDGAKAVRILNSWGLEWGENGKIWMDYEAFKSRYREAYIDYDPNARAVHADRGQQPSAALSGDRPESDEITAEVLNLAVRSNIGREVRTEVKNGQRVVWHEWNLWLDLPKRYLTQIDTAEYQLLDDSFPHPYKVKKSDSSLLMITWTGYDCVDAATIKVKIKDKPSVYGIFDHCKLEQTQKPKP